MSITPSDPGHPCRDEVVSAPPMSPNTLEDAVMANQCANLLTVLSFDPAPAYVAMITRVKKIMTKLMSTHAALGPGTIQSSGTGLVLLLAAPRVSAFFLIFRFVSILPVPEHILQGPFT